MTDPAAVEQLAAAVLAQHGQVDIVVNNAGFSSQGRHPLRTTAEEFRAVIDVNALGPIVLTRELLPGMIARGGGDVVLVNSMAALNPSVFPGVPYSAAKAAARAYMQVLAQEMRSDGIRCIDVFPGEVDTPILDNRPMAPDADARATMMMPEDIAEVIVLAVSLPRRTTMLEVPRGPRETARRGVRSPDIQLDIQSCMYPLMSEFDGTELTDPQCYARWEGGPDLASPWCGGRALLPWDDPGAIRFFLTSTARRSGGW